ncbi:unnamed protein product [Trichogramma brassicae]|uniref:Uncharacterized protein n=1 Tax=Trichogramma brassicae TaxID=86971 RepID=A0A6H5IPS0_9HYME|nr:unnamed protein product [Trichogramma brassicae]
MLYYYWRWMTTMMPAGGGGGQAEERSSSASKYYTHTSFDHNAFCYDYSSADDFEPLRKDVNWEVDEDRFELLCRLYDDVTWKWRLYRFPNFRTAFRDEEMDRLLSDCVNNWKGNHDDDWLRNFIVIVADSGYKDEPKDDNENRTTPIHRAARHVDGASILAHLFDIYDRYDLNYRDESGLTHFHVACQYGHQEVVEKFLEAGQDPNVVCRETGDSPLHLALKSHHPRVISLLLRNGADPNLRDKLGKTPLHHAFVQPCSYPKARVKLPLGSRPRTNEDELPHASRNLLKRFLEVCDEKHLIVEVDARDKLGNTPLHLALRFEHSVNGKAVELLLRRGADPNSANAEGSTPLHSICQRDEEILPRQDDLMKRFFEISDELNRTVRVDVEDKKGWTPLQLAVSNLSPRNVELLLERGADMTGFTFPTGMNYFDGQYRRTYSTSWSRLGLASRILSCVELLEKRGYEMDRGDKLAILKPFSNYGMFLESDYCNDDKNNDNDDEDFENKAKGIAVNSRVSLYDLIRSTEQLLELKQVTYADCERLSGVRLYEYQAFWSHRTRLLDRDTQLCEKISRKFFQDCALEPFWELMGGRLPLECCRPVLGQLTNKDLYNICLASATDQS